jgi:predicted glycogen debranching enzyme
LTHGDGETWMDAGGEQHPYSPRGNRAVEVQALYYNGLRVAEWLAGELARSPEAGASLRADWEQQRAAWEQERARYSALADRTRTGFRAGFWDAHARRLADHLDVDGSRDPQLRPNVILALTAVEPAWPPLLTAEEARAVVELVMEQLVLPWGVTSLDPSDRAFKPRHLDLNRYFFDEAYHNGDVWYWLTGPMITALCRTGRAAEAVALLEPLVAQALDHGAVGAIQEIRDGAQGDQQEEFGGAVFQAWSMAEMIRAMHEDLAGPMGWAVRTSRRDS